MNFRFLLKLDHKIKLKNWGTSFTIGNMSLIHTTGRNTRVTSIEKTERYEYQIDTTWEDNGKDQWTEPKEKRLPR